VEPYHREYFGDVAQVDEACCFYDDVSHDTRVWSQLFCMALSDLTLPRSVRD
jgi:hypothetical protein